MAPAASLSSLDAFNQEDFDDILQAIWTEGGEPDRVYLSADLMAKCVEVLEGNNNQRNQVSPTSVSNNVVGTRHLGAKSASSPTASCPLALSTS